MYVEYLKESFRMVFIHELVKSEIERMSAANEWDFSY